MDARIFDVFPDLARLEPAARQYLSAQLRPARLAPGAALFHPGGLCTLYPFVLEGRVVVRRIARSGREIVLYRVLPGQTCIMTTTCLIAASAASAEAVAESPVVAQALSPAGFGHLLETSAVFRGFAFGACARRIGDLMARIEEIADTGIDQRLARRLLVAGDGGEGDGIVLATHAMLAADIGSAREVVSRAMKQFAARGWVRAERGRVEILRREALGQVAAGAACDEVTDRDSVPVWNGDTARRLEP
jgi:CRP/FNR family transcriptional regulator